MPEDLAPDSTFSLTVQMWHDHPTQGRKGTQHQEYHAFAKCSHIKTLKALCSRCSEMGSSLHESENWSCGSKQKVYAKYIYGTIS
jgi:hypothetical protein